MKRPPPMLCSPVTRLPEPGAVKSRVDQFGEKVQRNLQSHLGVPHLLWPSRFVAQGQSPGAGLEACRPEPAPIRSPAGYWCVVGIEVTVWLGFPPLTRKPTPVTAPLPP